MRDAIAGWKCVASNEILIAAAVLAALCVIFFADVILANRTLVASGFAYERLGATGYAPPYGYPSDERPVYNYYLMDPLPAAWGSETAAEKASDVYGNFEMPLWSANQGMGWPVLASMDPATVSPLRSPLWLLPEPEMWDAFLILRLFVAGIATFLLARRLGLNKVAGIGAAAAFAFSGYFMLFMNMPIADSAMMAPIIVLSFDLLLERVRPLTVAFAALSVALSITAVNPEGGVVLITYGTAYYFARAVSRYGIGNWKALLRTVPPILFSGVAGVTLMAYFLLPFIELTGVLGVSGNSQHLHGPESRTGLEHSTLDQLVSIFVPYFKGATWMSFQANTWTGIRHYSGLVVPLLAVAAVWNKEPMRKAGWFFLGSTAILAAKWFGVPLINDLGRLPAYNLIAFTLYVPPVFALSVAMLAGIGIDQLARGQARWFHIAAGAAVIAALLAWVIYLNRDVFDFAPDKHLIKHVGFGLILVGAAVAVWLAAPLLRIPGALAAAAIIPIIAFELFLPTLPSRGNVPLLDEGPYEHDIPAFERPLRYDPFQRPPFVEFLNDQPGLFRVYGIDRLVYPNIATAYGLQDPRAYTATTVDRYIQYVTAFIDRDAGFRFVGTWPVTEDDEIVGNPFFDLMNVKYLMVRQGGAVLPGLESPDAVPGFSQQFHLVFSDVVDVYENTSVIPRAFLVTDVVAVNGTDAAIEAMIGGAFDPRTSTVIEDAPQDEIAALDPATPPAANVTFESYEDQRITLSVSTDVPALLVLTDTYYPGWKATVDGEDAEIYPADVAFRGVFLDAGEHTVEFTFQPASFRAGAIISILSVVALASYASFAYVWPRLRSSRELTPPSGSE